MASPRRDGQLPPILREHGRQLCGGVWVCCCPPWPGCGPCVDQVRPRAVSAGRARERGPPLVHPHITTVQGHPQPGPQSSPRPALPRLAGSRAPPRAPLAGPALSGRPGGSRPGIQAVLAAAHTAHPSPVLPQGAPPLTRLGSRASGSTVEPGRGVTGTLKDMEQEPPGL